MNDWIFCHNHSHGPEECRQRKKFDEVCQRLNTLSMTSEDNSNDSSNTSNNSYDRSLRSLGPVLTSLDQIFQLLSDRSDNKFLFDSEDKKFSMYLNILSDEFIVSSFSHQIESNTDIELTFENKSSVFYKVFQCHKSETNRQLNSYRFAFDIHYSMLASELFDTVLKTLLDSTRSVVSLGLRYDIESALYFGYL